MEEIFPSRRIAPSGRSLPLVDKPMVLAASYTYQGQEKSVDAYLAETQTQGLLVLKGNQVLMERMFGDARPGDRFTSWSISKSVTSLLIGIAIDQGVIGSVHDPVCKYVPELATSGYGEVTLENVLQMRSGVRFSEIYSRPISDVYWIWVKLYALGQHLAAYLAGLPRQEAPGGAFAYKSSDTAVLGLVLTRAWGKNLAALVQEQLWEPLGMQGEAYWMTDKYGQELAFCGLNATLRDYARLGAMVAQGGRVAGCQVVSEAWLQQSTQTSDPALQAGVADPNLGYQHQWWLPEGGRGEVLAAGVYGQYMYIDIPRQVVIVKTSADAGFGARGGENLALFRALAASI